MLRHTVDDEEHQEMYGRSKVGNGMKIYQDVTMDAAKKY